MEITGRKLFVKALLEEGVETLFAYPGGMITDIMDELYKTPDIHVVLPRHEQALVHEAEGYARATGKTGVALVTSGPGATNTITAIADAHYDSIPLVIFTGQVPEALIGNDAFQEVDIVGMTRSITKYSVTVKNRQELGRIIKMAFHIANTGKPGPVLVDIPKDIQLQKGSDEYPSHVEIRGYKPNQSVHIGQLKKAYKVLRSAKKPVILAGGGINIARANEALTQFAEKMQIPVATTVMGKGAISEEHPLYIGNAGMHGRYAVNQAIGACDVLFSIGTRFNDRITGDLNEFAPHAKIIHVDIDTASISRNVVVDVPVVSDANLALQKLMEWAEPMETEKWIRRIHEWADENPLAMRRDKGMTPQMIMEGINKVYPNSIVVTDVGQHQMWASQYIRMTKDKKFVTSGGLGTMGFGFPAALGAAEGLRDLGIFGEKQVVCVTGDGGFQMNMQEMATAICEKLPITICLLNNQYLGMVRQFQQVFYGKRYEITCLARRVDCPEQCKGPNPDCQPYVPDFMKWAESYGAHAIRVTNEDEIEAALELAKKYTDAPTLIEFIISTDEIVLPMVKGGNPMTEMILK
jgi:acetolactate synthase-1/2/3 large subunit